ncbi:MAG: hypothetical protein U0R50_17175 [Gaiellales bacterium]
MLGLTPRDLFGLVRNAQSGPGPIAPIAIRGPRATELAELLTDGGARSLATTAGDVVDACALVLLLETPAITGEVELLRRATRSGIPCLAVKVGDFPEPVPYVLAEDVFFAGADGALPVGEVVRALARSLPDGGVALGARLPSVQAVAATRRSLEAAITAGTLAATRSRGGEPLLPALSLLQARALRSVRSLDGAAVSSDPAAAAQVAGRELGLAVATGLACRTLMRRLPVRGRLVDGAVAALATFALLRLAGDRRG